MILDTLPDSAKDRIIDAGIELMASFTDALGADVGLEMWDKLSETIGEDFRGLVFMAMLNGRVSNKVRAVGDNQVRENLKFIDLIKCVRNYTGASLKEAKDVCDLMTGGTPAILTIIRPKERPAFLRELRELGVTIL